MLSADGEDSMGEGRVKENMGNCGLKHRDCG